MRGITRTPQQMADAVYMDVWNATEASQMNRKQRRSARGREIVAKAHAAALKAENDFLRGMLDELGITNSNQ